MPHLTNDQGPFRAEFTDDTLTEFTGDTLTWASNALTFETVDEAIDYARDLFMRWLGARAWRVVPTSHPQREEVDLAQDDEDGFPNSG